MSLDRRAFLKGSATLAGAAVISGPLQALSTRVARGQSVLSTGYGPLVDKGEIWLPAAFEYAVVQRQGDPMTPVDPATGVPDPSGVSYPTPSRFDGMAAFAGPRGTEVLIRNHENKKRYTGTPPLTPFIPANEVEVVVPVPYDSFYNGGVVKVVVRNGKALETYPLIGGTTHNCAGGPTPWGTWVTCEEFFQTNPVSGTRHGYIFEAAKRATGAVAAIPVPAAGRFEHEAVAWWNGVLYETEDIADSSFYRFTPSSPGNLAPGGTLEALRLAGLTDPGVAFDTRLGSAWPGGIGASHPVEWVPIANPDPDLNTDSTSVRAQGQAAGAARFARTEGCWAAAGRVFFDVTTGGGTAVSGDGLGLGQIFELDPSTQRLKLVFQQTSKESPALVRPDNLTLLETTRDVFIAEDVSGLGLPDPPPEENYIRALTREGLMYDFAKTKSNTTEFAGVCFSPDRRTMYVNQQGSALGEMSVTYAITGPWRTRAA